MPKFTKCFRLSKPTAYLLALASRETGIGEAAILDMVLERRFLKAVPTAEQRKAEAAGRAAATRLSAAKVKMAQDGVTGRDAQRSRRLQPLAAYLIGKAALAGQFTETDVVDAAIEDQIIGVTGELVERMTALKERRTVDALAQSLANQGVTVDQTRRTTRESRRFKAAALRSTDALKQPARQLSSLATGGRRL